VEQTKAWVGMGSPCDPNDMDLFYVSTTITIEYGSKANFLNSNWLNGLRPRQCLLLIYLLSMCKNYLVWDALLNGAWIWKIKLVRLFLDHLQHAQVWTLIFSLSFE
jgi:hypothetical protein